MSTTTEDNMSDDFERLGQMDVLDALPLLMDKLGVSKAEAYKMWYDHQKKVRVVDDVMTSEEFERRFPKSRSEVYSFKPGKSNKPKNDKQ